ncbi:MAG: hypothetical protein ACOVOW_01765, partial [Spirosomataceae bacterium]
EIFKDEIFTQAFEYAEIAKYNAIEKREYEQSLKVYRDLKGVIDTAFDEGKMEGKSEAKRETAKILKENGASNELIAIATGLHIDEIENL